MSHECCFKQGREAFVIGNDGGESLFGRHNPGIFDCR